jgi:poly-gamma-glutamate capsule biosynthesis protein CapA/YwtB (metallophosphatase superfamily)
MSEVIAAGWPEGRLEMSIFLCGDVMACRGIDQIMSRPSDPALHEPQVRSALDYVKLAERRSGHIPRHVPSNYIWGEALDEMIDAGPISGLSTLKPVSPPMTSPNQRALTTR